MHHIAANHLRHADAVITGFDQIAPEVEVFPATRNVGVTANPFQAERLINAMASM